MLTDTAIKAAKPKPKPYRIADSGGLCLEITPNGSKLWRYRYRYAGKAKMLSFGAYPDVTLANARALRDDARRLLRDGKDPSSTRKATPQTEHVQTFGALTEEWFNYISPRWSESTRYKARLYLNNDILPTIGNRPLSAITRPELVELVRKVEARGTLNAAGKIRLWLNQIFRYALAKGATDNNPATELNAVAALAPTVKHHPFVPLSEIPALLDALNNAPRVHMLTRNAIHLLMLTAARPGELRKAPWSEFDLDSATWTIPAARMKMRRPHIVPLPRQAVTILREIHAYTGGNALTFAGRNNPETPLSENTINRTLADLGYKGRQTGHGFRHLISTELNSRGYNRDWIERQLAHGDNNQIRDTYNHAHYLEQRRNMMQAWADELDTLMNRSNIVAFRRA